MAILFVEFCELIEVVMANAIAAFYRVQFLATSSKMEALWNVVSQLDTIVARKQ